MNSISSHIGFGGVALTVMRTKAEAVGILNAAYDMGIRHFDTAPLYGRGYSEMLIGSFIKNKRDSITITTKFGLGNCETGKIPAVIALPLNYYKKKFSGRAAPTQEIATPEGMPALLSHRNITGDDIRSSFERSLQRLKTDYIDYYFLHEGIPAFLDKSAMQYLSALKQKGVVRNIGIATDSYNIQAANPQTFNEWDVLQYETEAGNSLRNNYPGKFHIVHSCLKNITKVHTPGISDDEKGGYLLAQCAKHNPNGLVLFSTRRINTLRNNLNSFNKYFSLP